jgi:hypothetical protein
MSISLTSVRRLAASAVGASAVAGAMLFGATPAANAAPAAPMPQVVGMYHVAPPLGGGYGHGGFGHRGFDRGFGHRGFDRGFGHRGFDRGFDHRGFDRGFDHHRGWW